MASPSTTVKISRYTLSELEHLKSKWRMKSIDETIRRLLKSQRSRVLAESFGVDKGRVKPFREDDRDSHQDSQ